MRDQHLLMFIEESRENLDHLEAGLLQLETQGGGEVPTTVRELFRFAHNLKGMAATVGQAGITALAHRVEDLLDLFRSGVTIPSREAIDELLAATDALDAMLDQVPAGVIAEAPDGVLAALEARIIATADTSAISPPTGAPAAGAHPTLPEGLPEGACRFDIRLVTGTALPGARAAILIKAVENTGIVMSTTPDRDQILSGRTLAFAITALVTDPVGLATKLASLTDVEAVESTFGGPEPAEVPDSAPAGNQRTADTGHSRSRSGRQTVRVDVERLDDLIDLVGELVRGRSQLDQQVGALGDQRLADVAAGLSRTIADLQTAVARARMVTLEGTFTRLQRLVRETSRELGKDVALTVSGSQTELDRSVTDRVADPLVHLLRNALDHGIETREARIAGGKPARGHISLDAHTEGNQVIITIADDGAGIDTARVVAKAIAQGMVTAEDAARMDAADEQNLIFLPGLSTRDAATGVSGRGVGMDIVRSSIEASGGTVEVESNPGTGSTFRIRLPVSLAVMEVLLVSIGGQIWALPVPHIVETITVSALDLGGLPGEQIVRLRGEAIGLIHGNRVVGGGGPAPAPPFRAVVFRNRDQLWALSVEELLERTEVVVRPTPGEVADIPHVAGTTMLDDGRASMILDLAAVVPHATPRELREVS